MVLNKGCRWKVGTGQHIDVWKDLWIHDSKNFFVSTPVNQGLYGMKVCDLLIPGCQSWDHELLQEYFNQRDAAEISDIPLSSTLKPVQMIWHHTKDGVYSVRSGYKLIMKELEQNRSSTNSENWMLLWSLQVPPKFKSLTWRACRNSLPTRANLRSRGISCSSLCVICQKDIESTWHTFVTCPFAKQCWTANMTLSIIKCTNEAESFIEWVFTILKAEDKVVDGKLVAVLWTIWRQRNNKLWNDTIEDSNQAVRHALDSLYDWVAMRKKENGVKENTEKRGPAAAWRRPQLDFLKCNVDASFFSESRNMGFGMVIRDQEGKVVGCRSMIMDGLYDVKEGEAMGLREALSWICSLNFRRVIFEMDAQLVVRALNSSRKDESEFGSIIEDCQSIMKQEPSFSIEYVSQLGNEVAHTLAKEARSFANPSNWSSPPSYIDDIVTRDAYHA